MKTEKIEVDAKSAALFRRGIGLNAANEAFPHDGEVELGAGEVMECLNPADRFLLEFGFDLERLKGKYQYRYCRPTGKQLEGVIFFETGDDHLIVFRRLESKLREQPYEQKWYWNGTLQAFFPEPIEPGDHVIVTDNPLEAFAWMHCVAPNGRNYKTLVEMQCRIPSDVHFPESVRFTVATWDCAVACRCIKRMEKQGFIGDVWLCPDPNGWLSIYRDNRTFPQAIIDKAKDHGDKLIAAVLNRQEVDQ